MRFTYKAQKENGEVYEGAREAPDKFTLYKDLKKQGDTVLFANEAAMRSAGALQSLRFFGRISMHDKITFARNLGSMLEAGLPLSRALSVLERQSRKPKLKELVSALHESIDKGVSLSDSLSRFPSVFSSLFVSMVKAGEESGSLSSSLKIVALQMENVYTLERRVRGALIYPAVVLMVMALIGALMLVYVVPTLTVTFKDLNTALPLSTQIVIGVSDFLRNHSVVSLGLVLVCMALGYGWFKSKVGRRFFDTAFLALPVIGTLVRETNAARTARTLSSLLSAGVPVVGALSITADVLQNVFYRDVLSAAAASIEKGTFISAAFKAHENLYPAFLSEMVVVGEETGRLSEMLSGVAAFYEGEVAQKTKDLSTIIDPVLMVCIGLLVGFFAVAMITPLYSVLDTL